MRAVARDLGKLGTFILLIGRDLPEDSADLVLQVPAAPSGLAVFVRHYPYSVGGRASRHHSRCGLRLVSHLLLCCAIVRGESGLLKEIKVADRGEP
jgi:hypothetical protein